MEQYTQIPNYIIDEWRQKNPYKVGFYEFIQFLFEIQWKTVRNYAKNKKISIIGDIPHYLSIDSVDVWKNRQGVTSHSRRYRARRSAQERKAHPFSPKGAGQGGRAGGPKPLREQLSWSGRSS